MFETKPIEKQILRKPRLPLFLWFILVTAFLLLLELLVVAHGSIVKIVLAKTAGGVLTRVVSACFGTWAGLLCKLLLSGLLAGLGTANGFLDLNQLPPENEPAVPQIPDLNLPPAVPEAQPASYSGGAATR